MGNPWQHHVGCVGGDSSDSSDTSLFFPPHVSWRVETKLFSFSFFPPLTMILESCVQLSMFAEEMDESHAAGCWFWYRNG